MSKNDNLHYKTMDWYDLLGFSRNKMSNSQLTRENYCSKYLEIAYQNCLAMLNRNDLAEINLFYKIPTLNYCAGKIENIEELREKITEAYNTFCDPQRRKEYEFEIFGIFGCEYPEDEIADEKFRDRTIRFFADDDRWELESNAYWKNYLTLNYWKNRHETIKTMKYKEEIKFYIRKLGELRIFILKSTNWGKKPQLSEQFPDNENVVEEIKQKENELKNMSKEEWWKEKNKPSRDGEWREMTAKETVKFWEKAFGKFSDYGWNFNEEHQDKPVNINEDYENICESKNELLQLMKKNDIEEIIYSQNNGIICKNSKGNVIQINNDNGVNIHLDLNRFGGKTITRQQLENELKINNSNSEKEQKNSFSLNPPWLIAGGVLILASVLLFRTRKKYK